jgi:RimJ/RimL family protein N-acetyltransferase
MKKIDQIALAVPLRERHVQSPADAARAVAAAASRISARRARDVLPVRIQTPRLVLRAPIRGDVPDIVRLADNRKIHDMLSRLPSPYTRADGIAFVEILAQRADERPYAVTLDGSFIGVVGFTYFKEGPPELGYWLGEPYWGKGFMTEAARALLDAAFATGLYPLVKSRALATNTASLNALEKMGFKRLREGTDETGTLKGKPMIFLSREQPRWM